MNITVNPSSPSELDRAFLLARSPGDVITARGGNFTTKGNWGFPNYCHLASGVTLDFTDSTLKFDTLANLTTQTGGVTRPDKDLNILWGEGNNTIIGGKFDATPPAGWYGGGLRFSGVYKVSGSTIVGLKGSWAANVEVFAVSSQGNTDGSIVENVTVKEVAQDSYVSGIYVGATVYPVTVAPSVVTNCNVDLGFNNQFAYSSTRKTVFTNCVGSGVKYGLYTDTRDMVAVLIGCKLTASWAAISSIGMASTTRMVSATNCELTGERGIEWWDKTGTADVMVGGVVISASTLNSKYTATVLAKKGNLSIVTTNILQPVNLVVSPGCVTPMVLA